LPFCTLRATFIIQLTKRAISAIIPLVGSDLSNSKPDPPSQVLWRAKIRNPKKLPK